MSVRHFLMANTMIVCDSMSMALIRYRKGGFLRLDSDEEEDEPVFRPQARQYY